MRALAHALLEVVEGEICHGFAPPWHITSARTRKSGACGACAGRFTSSADRLASADAGRARFLVRFRLDLFLPGGGAHRRRWPHAPTCGCAFGRSCSGRSSRRRAGTPRRSISIRPRAATCGATSSGCAPDLNRAVPPARSFPAEQPAGGARRAGRADAGLGRGFCRRGVPRAIRRRPAGSTMPHAIGEMLARLNVDPQHRARRRADRTTSRRGCGRRPTRRSGSACSARRASPPPTANCSGATTGSNRRCAGRPAAAR